jgi:hypothetical protein
LTWDDFLREEAAPRLGGDAAAARFLEIVAMIDSEAPLERNRLGALRDEALDGAMQTGGDASRRWLWLADRIARREFNSDAGRT